MEDERNVACHEAGHGIVAVSLRLELIQISARPTGQTAGLSTYRCGRYSMDNLIATVAGDTAVRLFGSYHSDQAQMTSNEFGSDGRQAAEIANRLAAMSSKNNRQTVDVLIDGAIQAAELILKANRAVIIPMVGILVRDGIIMQDHPMLTRIIHAKPESAQNQNLNRKPEYA
jgi:hypothetical protein